jgi:type III secretion protein D
MKKLRILTGRHSGASLDLPTGSHLLGPGGDCDITITDWSFAPLRLHVGGDGDDNVAIEWTAQAPEAQDDGSPPAAAQSQWRKLADFEPREFDGTVICVGPAKGVWPSDMALLDAVFKPTPGRVAKWAGSTLRTRRAGAISAAAVVTLVLIFSAVVAGARRPPPPAPSIDTARAELQLQLDRVADGQLHVKIEPAGLVVTGMVDTSEQAAAVRTVMQARRGPFPLLPRFTLATDVAETIRGTVGLRNAAVKHVGGGVFTYVAEATDEAAARAAIERVSADLASTVKRIDATFERTDGRESGPILSRLTVDGMSVVQTRDGVKHLVVTSSVSQRDALDLPSRPFNSQPGASAIPTKE